MRSYNIGKDSIGSISFVWGARPGDGLRNAEMAPPPPPAHQPLKCYKPSEAAALLGVGKKKIYELMNSGALEYFELGGDGDRRIKHEALDAFIAANTPKGKKGSTAIVASIPRPV